MEWKQLDFDPAAADRARDMALDAVWCGADTSWLGRALAAVEYVARRRVEFTTDAVWKVLADAGTREPREPRAMGAVMREAVRRGVCVATDRVVKSTRVACHGRPVRVWRRAG